MPDRSLLQNIDNLIVITENAGFNTIVDLFKIIIKTPIDFVHGLGAGTKSLFTGIKDLTFSKFMDALFFPGAYKESYFINKVQKIYIDLHSALNFKSDEIVQRAKEIEDLLSNMSADDMLAWINKNSKLFVHESQISKISLKDLADRLAQFEVEYPVLKKYFKSDQVIDYISKIFHEGAAEEAKLFGRLENESEIAQRIKEAYSHLLNFFSGHSSSFYDFGQKIHNAYNLGKTAIETLPSNITHLVGQGAKLGATYGAGKTIWDRVLAPAYGFDSTSDKVNRFIEDHPYIATGAGLGIGGAALAGAGLGAYNLYKNMKNKKK